MYPVYFRSPITRLFLLLALVGAAISSPPSRQRSKIAKTLHTAPDALTFNRLPQTRQQTEETALPESPFAFYRGVLASSNDADRQSDQPRSTTSSSPLTGIEDFSRPTAVPVESLRKRIVTYSQPATAKSFAGLKDLPDPVAWDYKFTADGDIFNMPLTGREFTVFNTEGVEILRLETALKYKHTVTLKPFDQAREYPIAGKLDAADSPDRNFGISKSSYFRGFSWFYEAYIEFIQPGDEGVRAKAHIKRNTLSVFFFGQSWTLTVPKLDGSIETFIVLRRPFMKDIRIFKKENYDRNLRWSSSRSKSVMTAFRMYRNVQLTMIRRNAWDIKGMSEHIPPTLALLLLAIIERRSGLSMLILLSIIQTSNFGGYSGYYRGAGRGSMYNTYGSYRGLGTFGPGAGFGAFDTGYMFPR